VVQPAPPAAEGNGPVQQRRSSGWSCWPRQISDQAYSGTAPANGTWRTPAPIGVFSVRDGKIASVREYTDTQRAERLFAAR
jgi:hypothetical protein